MKKKIGLPCNNCGDRTPAEELKRNDGECDDCQVDMPAVMTALDRYQTALGVGLQATFALREGFDPGAVLVYIIAGAAAAQAEREAAQ